jgi:hypothetical protein
VRVSTRALFITGGVLGAGGLALIALTWRKEDDVPFFDGPQRFVPGSTEQIRLFEEAALLAGLPTQWARSPGLINILKRESDGWVGRPNYTYGTRARDKSRWGEVWDELRRGIKATRSSATGLGQLILENVDKYYPSGRAGIGSALDEAQGMLRYIQARYGTPERAWELYGKLFEGY